MFCISDGDGWKKADEVAVCVIGIFLILHIFNFLFAPYLCFLKCKCKFSLLLAMFYFVGQVPLFPFLAVSEFFFNIFRLCIFLYSCVHVRDGKSC